MSNCIRLRKITLRYIKENLVNLILTIIVQNTIIRDIKDDEREGRKLLITRETDYALRILRALAGGELLNSVAICEQEALPQHFTYKILKKLNKAGVIRILRGVEGGCQLTADLKNLSLYDLISITEGQKAISSCMEATFQCQWQQKFGSKCQIHQNLQVIQNSLDQQLKTYSIHDMLFKEKSC